MDAQSRVVETKTKLRVMQSSTKLVFVWSQAQEKTRGTVVLV